ncbi:MULTISPECIES: type I-E CRISPR-associated protein Cas5/CasD [Dehalococcoides]|jgi:CRISPR-associated protein Cas5, Ecoli subtype|uniref:CRISPR-associated protein Cas5 n=2 Tax=Dehalococcoides mccartyi TaxID=61435 RepID=A0A142VC05_9CHLR|nr:MULTISPECIES: type I-E CRISPR-associated protein Cas5/CasD [Dehalococcoides]AGG06996.1 CRISPR-associated protein Cas5 [Dehalococcoides mccartyi DCMB5]AMU87199.1 CRISPR-associated protein Cas5 [Dehalococcoides mccartyi]AQX73759.1 type I-E CRISPR-associated protein Cas5/CasD [Dehalococcoides mccartyi]PKH45758.1 type I-E CRISPR-associated protein Cas5/CasD [Dehalococcoides mccartyi]PKH48038.1 type I-E CRISPR-associated protein Cas5/CasD [Dehalococcoides mccartyi]
MSEKCTLLMRLEGPMQSWGYRSRFDCRDTALEPTRSGVIGLICAAMGIARDEDIARFDGIRMGVRVDRDGKVEQDYHTALDVIKADGSGKDTVVSYRDYLTDASFTVGLESSDRNLLEKIAKALVSPQWVLFLGRKAFPLTKPPIFEFSNPVKPGSLEEHLLCGASAKRVLLESPDGERTQYDWPLCFGERRFKPRRFTVKYVPA